MLYPLTFHPILKERVWGGRRLQTLYGKPVPAGVTVGESWEVSDRPGDESVVANGPLAGRSLRWLMEHAREDLLGVGEPGPSSRFPLLCKILDARQKLSLQVHPPPAMAAALSGEPKTEMWHIVEADPGAELFVGLRPGVTRADFEARIASGDVAECFHRIPVRAGDTMFLPSGRVHAIGDGLVIFEIQQNSDTTYRVFDWNRLGLDGKPRELHLAESLASIDFDDVEPSLQRPAVIEEGPVLIRALVRHPLFDADLLTAPAEADHALGPERLRVVAITQGEGTLTGGGGTLWLKAGQFGVLPARMSVAAVTLAAGSRALVVTPGRDPDAVRRGTSVA